MKRIYTYGLWAMMICTATTSGAQNRTQRSGTEMKKIVENALAAAVDQYRYMMKVLPDSVLPRTIHPDGSLRTSDAAWWTSGFYPGTLWYLFEYSNDEEIRSEALKRTHLLEQQQFNTGTHDLGFMMFCSYGHAFRLTGNERYRSILIQSANSLATRFHPIAGVIRSWDFGKWQYPVIIDNMMNLELLLWASRSANQPYLDTVAVTHARTTLKNHFRHDFSCYHVVDYDTVGGHLIHRGNYQGYADTSAWARGQGWALYGYTMMYRETRDPAYLKHAEQVADFILNHPTLPDDKVPYWDFNDPIIPQASRDASAGALIASALVELSQYTDKKRAAVCWKIAGQILQTLSSPAYFAANGTNNGFILKNSVGSMPHGSEVDVPLTYADYYYVEALMRYKATMR